MSHLVIIAQSLDQTILLSLVKPTLSEETLSNGQLGSGVKVKLNFSPYMGLDARKTCLGGSGNNKSADQPTHPPSLISAFVIRFLESIISKLATGDISIF